MPPDGSPPPERSGARLRRNTVAQAAAKTAWIGISIALTPYLFAALGRRSFGTWSLLSGFASMALLLDFGLTPAVVRLVAGARCEPDRARARRALGVALETFALVGLLLPLVTWLAEPVVAGALHVDGIAHLRTAAVLTAAAVGVCGVSVPFGAVLDGRQRMELTALASVLAAVASGALTAALLALGLRLLAPALGLLGYAVVRGTVVAVACLRVFGELRPRLRGEHGGLRGELLGYGARVQATNLAAVVNVECDRWVIAGAASASLVAPYDVAARLTALLRVVPSFALFALFPEASAAHRRGDSAALERLYSSATRYLTLGAAGCAAMLCAGAAPLLQAWIGRPLPFGAEVVWLLAPAVGLNVCTGGVSVVLRAEGRPGRETRYAMLSLIVNLVLTGVFLVAFGPLGAVAGSAGAIVVASLYFFWSFHRSSGRPLRPLVGVVVRAWLAALVGCAAGLPVGRLVAVGPGRFTAAAAALAAATAALLVYLLALTVLRCWTPAERGRVRGMLRRGLPLADGRELPAPRPVRS